MCSLSLVPHGDRWESAVSVSTVWVSAAFVWVSHFSGIVTLSLCRPSVSSLVSEWWHSSVIIFPVAGGLSPECQNEPPPTPISPLVVFSVSLSTSTSSTSVFGPGEWGWKGSMFVFKPKQFTDGWRGVDLCGCDKSGFLPQKHSKPMWQSCSVCWQKKHLRPCLNVWCKVYGAGALCLSPFR